MCLASVVKEQCKLNSVFQYGKVKLKRKYFLIKQADILIQTSLAISYVFQLINKLCD